jgi:AcrR family transcriptional regulator
MRKKDENKLEQIFQSTLKLVSLTGIAGVSVAAIARETGIGTGSFYTYFKSKEELMNALFLETRRVYGQKLFSDYSAEEPVKTAMKKIWANYLRYRVEYYEHCVFQDQYMLSPYMQNNQEIREFSLQTVAALLELLNKGKQEMIIKNFDNVYFGLMLKGFTNELSGAIRFGKIKYTEDLIDTSFGLFWDAIRE